jgi:hypothetical protein
MRALWLDQFACHTSIGVPIAVSGRFTFGLALRDVRETTCSAFASSLCRSRLIVPPFQQGHIVQEMDFGDGHTTRSIQWGVPAETN